MKDAGDAASEWWRGIQRALDERRHWWEARGVVAGVREKNWRLACKLLPRDVTTDELAQLEPALAWSEERLRQCRTCPAHGGACDAPFSGSIENGKFPVWDERERDIEFVWCIKFQQHLLRQRLRMFGVPEVLLGATFENFTADVALGQEARLYVENFSLMSRAEGYQFVGGTGTGKSHLAAAVVRGLVERRLISTAFFAFVPRLLEEMRANYDRTVEERDEFHARLTKCDLLVLDDLGAERATDWVREQIGIILHERWANQRPVLVTSNRMLEEYRATLLNERAYSRLQALVPYVRHVGGRDQRRP